MRKLSFALVALPVVLLLFCPGCSLDAGMAGAIDEAAPAHFAGDGIEGSADQRM